mmetsp:Transcript_5558/g.23618  ORF Transcript_5558/g.23618 Transcript_5558/m.23618 type:complete len:119 (-) Transcript_5558:921-1277(-)
MITPSAPPQNPWRATRKLSRRSDEGALRHSTAVRYELTVAHTFAEVVLEREADLVFSLLGTESLWATPRSAWFAVITVPDRESLHIVFWRFRTVVDVLKSYLDIVTHDIISRISRPAD